nr:hypothetical protein [Lachnospiraceae bacterium]
MKSSENNKRYIEILFVLIASFAIVFGVCLIMGTMSSDYHLVDDHEYLTCTFDRMNGLSFWRMVYYNVTEEGVRFRPLYMFFRSVLTEIFKTNIIAYFIIKAIETAFSMTLLYFVARNHNVYPCGKLTSAVFSVVALVGYQSATWWKLGTHEIQGIMFFSAGFLFVESYLRNGKKINMVMALIIFEMMGLLKENLFLLLPFVGLYVLFTDMRSKLTEEPGKNPTLRMAWELIKNRIWFYVFLILIFAEVMLACLFFITPTEYKTSGLVNFDISNWASAAGHDLKWFILFGLVFTGILLTYFDHTVNMWMDVVLTLVFVIPQIFVYSDTGMSERYILPSSIAYALFFVVCAFGQKTMDGLRKKIYIAALVLLILAHARAMLREADYFRWRGNGVQTALEYTEEIINENPDVKVCCTFAYPESNETFEFWAKLFAKDDIYFYWPDDTRPEGYVINRKYWNADAISGDYAEYGADEMDVYVTYSAEDRHFTSYPLIDLSDFDMTECGTL